jgi:hypothetical protein
MPVRPRRWRLPDLTINPDGAGHDIFAPGCAPPCQWFSRLAAFLDRRSAPRLAWLFLGAVLALARGRRTVTSWIRAAGLSTQFRPCYTTVAAAGKKAISARLVCEVVKPLVADRFSLEITFRDCKEIVGAGQQQVRFVWANIGAFHICLWTFTMAEAWGRAEGDLIPNLDPLLDRTMDEDEDNDKD